MKQRTRKHLLIISLSFIFAFSFVSIKAQENNVATTETQKKDYYPVYRKDTLLNVDDVYMHIEGQTLPEYPGGMNKMFSFISENYKYPDIAKKAKAAGRVTLRFVIKKNGNIVNIEVVNTQITFGGKQFISKKRDEKTLEKEVQVRKAMVEEAVRVVQAMPKWKPAAYEGEPFHQYMTLPIKLNY